MKFLANVIKETLLSLGRQNLLPCEAEDFDAKLLEPAINSVSYTVSMLTVLHNKQSFNSEYEVLLERAYDSYSHLNALLAQQRALGLHIDQMGNYMFKASSTIGYTLFTIAPTKTESNILANTN